MAELSIVLFKDTSLFSQGHEHWGAPWSSMSSTRQAAPLTPFHLSPSALMAFSDTFMLHLRTWKSFCSFQAMIGLRNSFSSPFPKLLVRKQVAKTLSLGSRHTYNLNISLFLPLSQRRVFSSLRKYEILLSSVNILTLPSVLSTALRT